MNIPGLNFDRSEKLDPYHAADELIMHAEHIKTMAENNQYPVPAEAQDVLNASREMLVLALKRRGLRRHKMDVIKADMKINDL